MAAAPHTVEQNPRTRETARRRPAYAAIDAAYYAGAISEAAKNLAKWQLRVLCGIRTFFDTTQAEQAQQFICPRNQRHLSRRHIIRLNQELEAAGLIWREVRGTSYRTYITEYEPKPIEQFEEPDAYVEEQPTEAHESTYAELRQAIDQALAIGQVGRAAMLEYHAAMVLARQANMEVPGTWQQGTAPAPGLFFDPPKGDNGGTDMVTITSPTTFIKHSGIPYRDTESSVCIGDDDRNIQQQSNQTVPDVPDTAATRLLMQLGVTDSSILTKFSAAPLDLIERAEQRRAQLGYSPGMIVRILRDGGTVWPHGRTQRGATASTHKYVAPCPQCSEQSAFMTLDPPFCPTCRYRAEAPCDTSSTADDCGRAGEDTEERMHLSALWQHIISRIDANRTSCETWLKPAYIVHCAASDLVIACPNIFVRQEIEDHYPDQLHAAAKALLGYTVKIELIIRQVSGSGPDPSHDGLRSWVLQQADT